MPAPHARSDALSHAEAGRFLDAARCYSELGEAQQALDCLVRVRPDDPSYRSACAQAVALAVTLDASSLEFETFIASFVRSGPRDDAELLSFYELGRLYLSLGIVENAREAFSKIRGTGSSYRDSDALLASLRPEGPSELPDLPEIPQLPEPAGVPSGPAAADRGFAARRAGRVTLKPGEAEPDDESPAFVVGATIADRYRLEERIGRGGMSVVFKATDLELGDEVALKVFTQAVYDEETDGRFKRELRLSRQLVHANIVRLFDIGLFRGFRYINMELLVGSDLRDAMSAPLPIAVALDYLIQAAAGLGAAHEKGVVHRDIKPENCFITTEGVLKLMDFGIAKVTSTPGLTSTGIIAGTPAYMSPEQMRDFSGVTPASDLYSLGIVAYEMFTGRVPFVHPEMMTLFLMHSNDPPIPPRKHNRDVPEPLEEVVLRLLEKDPARRFASARDLGERLLLIARDYGM